MSHFCLLSDPANYCVSDIAMAGDSEARRYWLKLFEDHFAMVLESAAVAYGRGSARQIKLAGQQFAEIIVSLREPSGPADERCDTARDGPLDVARDGPLDVARDGPLDAARDGPLDAARDGQLDLMWLCRLREKALRDNGLDDPFRHVKERENLAAVASYPDVVNYAASLPAEKRWEHLVRGIFAGNIFDLGSTITMGYTEERVDFEATIEQLKPRPWIMDDFDELGAVLPISAAAAAPWAKAVVFVDNAGADFILGVMPFVRQLAAHGTHIVLAANELPSLNDITADETVEIVRQLAGRDDDLASYVSAGLFEVVSTGNDIPLIDLAEVSDELNEAAADADLVILEGMGRSIESNLETQFTVDSIQLCLLKDPAIASRVGGELFDCICVYRRGTAH